MWYYFTFFIFLNRLSIFSCLCYSDFLISEMCLKFFPFFFFKWAVVLSFILKELLYTLCRLIICANISIQFTACLFNLFIILFLERSSYLKWSNLLFLFCLCFFNVLFKEIFSTPRPWSHSSQLSSESFYSSAFNYKYLILWEFIIQGVRKGSALIFFLLLNTSLFSQ